MPSDLAVIQGIAGPYRMKIFTRAMPPVRQLNLLYLADLAALWAHYISELHVRRPDCSAGIRNPVVRSNQSCMLILPQRDTPVLAQIQQRRLEAPGLTESVGYPGADPAPF